MKYKVSIHLDEVLKEKQISQYSLNQKTHLSLNFINKLAQHKEVANLDKLATIINTLNEEGYNIKPSDLITFDPVGETKIKVIESQHRKNVFLLFFQLNIHGEKYLDLIKLTIKQKDKQQLFIKAEANDTLTLNQSMQRALFAQSFTLGQGVEKLVQLSSAEKRVAAQALAKEVINQAIASKVISAELTYTLSMNYFDLFAINFNHLEQKNNQVRFIKDKNDSLIPLNPNAYQATYPFMHAASIGRVTKGEHLTPHKPHKLTEEEKHRLDELFFAFTNKPHK